MTSDAVIVWTYLCGHNIEINIWEGNNAFSKGRQLSSFALARISPFFRPPRGTPRRLVSKFKDLNIQHCHSFSVRCYDLNSRYFLAVLLELARTCSGAYHQDIGFDVETHVLQKGSKAKIWLPYISAHTFHRCANASRQWDNVLQSYLDNSPAPPVNPSRFWGEDIEND